MSHIKTKQKHTYIVEVQLTLKPIIYIEVVADNQAQALEQVEQDRPYLLKLHPKAFKAEVLTELSEAYADQLKLISCGRASQYHSESECELCRQVKRGKS